MVIRKIIIKNISKKLIVKKSVLKKMSRLLTIKKSVFKKISYVKNKNLTPQKSKILKSQNKKLNLVIFHSEGPPYDNAKKINNLGPLFKTAKKHVDKIAEYTPRKLKELGYHDYVKEYPNRGVVSHNSGMNMIGFCAWRPLIMLLELEKVKNGDIIVYRDCNIHKYKGLLNYTNFRNICNKLLKECGFDIFVPRENNTLKLKNHCKTNVIRDIGNNNKFFYEFPLLLSGFIIVKKSSKSIYVLKEWLKYCEKEEYINGEVYGSLHKDFKWSTPEQSLLGIVIAKMVKERKFNIPIKYPKHIISARKFKISKVTNYDYLKYL